MRLSIAAFGLLALLALAGTSTMSSTALADVPGPRDVCEVEGLGCEQCWRSYSSDPNDEETFKKCADSLAAKNLKEACSHRQGAGDAVFFCPEGTKAQKVTKDFGGGGGCAGCGVGSGSAWGALAALALAVGIAARRRRNENR